MLRGRPKKFDEQQALQSAMNVFWTKGYENSSCGELLTAMGINCGSMYATFGDKKALYEKSFDLYTLTIFNRGVELLNQPGSPLENVRSLVRGWGEFMSQSEQKGCFVSNAHIEFNNVETGIGKRAKRLIKKMQLLFEEKLSAAQAAGELSSEANPQELAAFLINTAQGLSVMARSGADEKTIQGIIRSTLLLLR